MEEVCRVPPTVQGEAAQAGERIGLEEAGRETGCECIRRHRSAALAAPRPRHSTWNPNSLAIRREPHRKGTRAPPGRGAY